MNPAVIGTVAFACTLGGVLLGIALRAALPDHHVSNESCQRAGAAFFD